MTSSLGHREQEPRTHDSTQLIGSSLETDADKHMTLVHNSRQDDGRRATLFFRNMLFRARTIRRTLAWVGQVFRSLSLVVGVIALGGNSRLMVLMENLHSGLAFLKSCAF